MKPILPPAPALRLLGAAPLVLALLCLSLSPGTARGASGRPTVRSGPDTLVRGPGRMEFEPSDERLQSLLPVHAAAGRAAPRLSLRGSDGLAGHPGEIVAGPMQAADRWLELPPPGRYQATGLYDSAADRVLVCGGVNGSARTDLWALDLGGPARWEQVPVGGERPLQGRWTSAALDPVHRRVYFVSWGWRGQGPEVQVLDLRHDPRWRQVRVRPLAPAPRAREGPALVYDSRRHRLVLFGGLGNGMLSDTWELDLASRSWRRMTCGGDSIPGLMEATALYDPDGDRMLVYGGYAEVEPHLLDRTDALWSLELHGAGAWHRIVAGGDSTRAREGAALIRDPLDGGVLLLGGNGADALSGPSDVFRLTERPAPSWTRIVPAGGLARPRYGSAVAYDSRRGRLLLFGGGYPPLDRADVDVLTLGPAPAWSAIPAAPLPAPRFGQAMALDTKRGRLAVFGGVAPDAPGDGYLDETWTAPLSAPGQWTPLAPSGPAPPPRHEPVMVYDPRRDRLVAFGGWTYPSNYLADVWVLDLASGAWTQAQPAGDPPPGRRAHAAVLDPARDRMLVFGGFGPAEIFEDVWALHLGEPMRWERLEPAGEGPGPRYCASLVHDPGRDRVLLYGGAREVRYGAYTDVQSIGDTWALSLAELRWVPVADALTIPGLARHTAVFDAERDRMIVFGGWEVRASDFFVLYGGVLFSLELGAAPHWTWSFFEEGPGARAGHAAAFDPDRDRMVTFGGSAFVNGLNDTWLLQCASDGSASGRPRVPGWSSPSATGPRLAVRGLPNPASASALALRLSLAPQAPAVLEIFDLQGRRVASESVSPRASGETVIHPGARLRPGVYLVRLSQEDRSVTRRICVLD